MRLDCFWQFLRMRYAPDGEALNDLLGVPSAHEEGWFRSQWLALKVAEDRELVSHGWVRAWHGAKLEAICSTMWYTGCVRF